MTNHFRNIALLFIVLLLGCHIVAARAAAQSNGTAVRKSKKAFDAEKVLAPWIKMWNNYDLAEVDKLFINDASVTYFSSEKPGLIRGIEALRAHHAGFGFVKGGKAATTRLWLEDIHSSARGNVYVVTATWFFSRGDGSNRAQKGPMTFVYAAWRGQYRIAHGHFANDPVRQ